MVNTKSRAQKIKVIQGSRRNFTTIFDTLDISPEDMNKPLIGDNFNPLGKSDPLLGLKNPYSKATCLILYLYSMELGSPQLYAEANRVARDKDFTMLQELGPFL